MVRRLRCWTLGLALVCPGTLASAQPPPPQGPDPSARLRLEAPPPPPSPLDVTPTTGWPLGLRTLATCPTCPTDDDRTPVTTGNAPWRIGTSYTVGEAFNHVSFGVVGHRNERLPLFMTVPIGTPIGPAPAPSYGNATSDTRAHWLATIAAEKTLYGWDGGQTLGALGEAFLPLGAFGPKPASFDTPSPSGRGVRGAFRVRF